jgi:hypothetical protein
MSQTSDPKWTNAFTRASVQAYLEAADAECVRIEAAIAAARERAQARQQQLDAFGAEPVWNRPAAAPTRPRAVPELSDRLDSPLADETRWRQPNPAAVSGD